MTSPADSTRITQIATVFVPVSDQERSLVFYRDKLGFEKRADFVYGEDSRWIEVAPRDSANAIALVPLSEGQAVSADTTHCALATEDIVADHAALLAAGVDVDPEIGGTGTSRAGLVSTAATIPDPTPPQFLFRDPDGNRFLVVEPPADPDR